MRFVLLEMLFSNLNSHVLSQDVSWSRRGLFRALPHPPVAADVHETSSVEGEARVDLAKFRQDGQSIELWEKLQPIEREAEPEAGAGKAASGPAETAAAELHLLITYCPSNQVRDERERESLTAAAWFDVNKGVRRVLLDARKECGGRFPFAVSYQARGRLS